MSLTQAYSVLYDSSDTEVGTTANPFTIDGAGVAGTPAGGVVSIQGVTGGTAVLVDQGSPALIADAWYTRISNGTNEAEVINTTPVGTEYGLVVRQAGPVTFTQAFPATSTVTSVALSTTVATVLALNANRLGVIIWNDGNQNAFVKLGAAATTASFTARLSNKSEWEIPQPNYTGVITGITNAGTATLLVTELTP